MVDKNLVFENGKYKGQSAITVVKNDPEYVVKLYQRNQLGKDVAKTLAHMAGASFIEKSYKEGNLSEVYKVYKSSFSKMMYVYGFLVKFVDEHKLKFSTMTPMDVCKVTYAEVIESLIAQ